MVNVAALRLNGSAASMPTRSLPVLKAAVIPEETWLRVLVLQRLFEDLADALGAPQVSTSFSPTASSPSDDIIGLLELRASPILRAMSQGAVADYGLDSDEARRIDAGFVVYEHVDSERGAGFELELWRSRSLLPDFIRDLLRYLSVDKRTGITAENHGMGYHIHFIKRAERTDVLLLFDPTEPTVEMPVLYWERHAEGHCVAARPPPDRFGLTMRQNIYGKCKVLLKRRDKAVFRRLSKESARLFPISRARVA